MILSKIYKGVRQVFRFITASLIISLHYDRSKFIDGRWFKGKYNNLGALGWVWVIKDYCLCKKRGVNIDCPWPVSPDIRIGGYENITFHPDDLNNFQTFGCYFQGYGKITIGHGTYIAPNVGIITANHDVTNLKNHVEPKDVFLGENCWIGMNSIILPDVQLGDNTIVGAGSVVTKSFPEGNCIIAGNPARLIRKIDRHDT